MSMNTSALEANVTLEQIASALNVNVSVGNLSDPVTAEELFSLYDAYRLKEQELMITYRTVAYVLGTLIILSNLTVVISSGLILRKGQQPKSTYLLLGNVSLADTIIGISIIFGAVVGTGVNSSVLCVFQIGMIVCPTLVSIFSVGLIAIDRYIYIIHGLYYQRWINTTRVRIGILMIWLVGLILSSLPATGWTTLDNNSTQCNYAAVFPSELIIFNAMLSFIPVLLVCVLYSIILVRAIKNIIKIRTSNKQVNVTDTLRIYRGNTKHNMNKDANKIQRPYVLKKSASMSEIHRQHRKLRKDLLISIQFCNQSKSIDDLNDVKQTKKINNNIIEINERTPETHFESKLSIATIESDFTSVSSQNISMTSVPTSPCKLSKCLGNRLKSRPKSNEPRMCKAVTVVMLTSGSFIFTWVPFFIALVMYVLCEDRRTNPKCFPLAFVLRGPLAILAYLSSLFNPLIYAWWHKSFKNAVKDYFKRYIL